MAEIKSISIGVADYPKLGHRNLFIGLQFTDLCPDKHR